jgi:hypothetical protein
MKQTNLLAVVFVLLCLSANFTFAQDGLPLHWRQSGSKPQDFEVVVDEKVKHQGKASARVDFIGDTFAGFLSLAQTFKADAYRGKRVRLSAWVKTKSPDSQAQLWFRLDALKRGPGFDNMSNRPIKGITDWAKYDLVLDVPEDVVAIVFGVMSLNQGTIWVDDFSLEIVGHDVAVTNMLTPEAMKQERNNSALANAALPPQPLNLDFEGGANPVRKAVAIDPVLYADLAGYYTHPNGDFLALSQDAGKFMLNAGGGKTEIYPLSATEFFIKFNPNRYFITKDDKGKVTALTIKSEANESHFKKINTAEVKARAAGILAAAYQAKGGEEKLRGIRDVQFDSTLTQGTTAVPNKFFLSSQLQFRHEIGNENTPQLSLTVSNGKNLWRQINGKPVLGSQQQLLGWWQQVWWLFTLQPFPGKTVETLWLGERQLNGKPVDTIVLLIDHFRYVLSFDQESHLLVRSTHVGGDDVLYEDFRSVNGIQFPFKAIINPNGQKAIVTMREYKINAGIEPSKLTPPQ